MKQRNRRNFQWDWKPQASWKVNRHNSAWFHRCKKISRDIFPSQTYFNEVISLLVCFPFIFFSSNGWFLGEWKGEQVPFLQVSPTSRKKGEKKIIELTTPRTGKIAVQRDSQNLFLPLKIRILNEFTNFVYNEFNFV